MKNILIDFSGDLTRIALVNDGELVELIVQRAGNASLTGNIYAGIVKNILPSQFAFVDIGQEKNAFLYLNDNKEEGLFEDGRLSIKNGQSLLVQVTKDAHGTKGAGVTTQLSFQGRNIIIYRNREKEIGISKKITDQSERLRLKKIASEILTEGLGIIMRTSSRNLSREEIAGELDGLMSSCERVYKYGEFTKAPALVFRESGELKKAVRDLAADVENIIINDRGALENATDIAEEIHCQVSLYSGEEPIFVRYGLEKQIEKALRKKVWLDSGSFLIIEQTEACAVIDVNTGKFAGNKNQRQTALKINLEAAGEIAKQIRLRNLSGMIIVDFINLKHESDRGLLLERLKERLKDDRLGVGILGMTELGLVQLTRRKTRESLPEILLTDCHHCGGTGKVHRFAHLT